MHSNRIIDGYTPDADGYKSFYSIRGNPKYQQINHELKKVNEELANVRAAYERHRIQYEEYKDDLDALSRAIDLDDSPALQRIYAQREKLQAKELTQWLQVEDNLNRILRNRSRYWEEYDYCTSKIPGGQASPGNPQIWMYAPNQW